MATSKTQCLYTFTKGKNKGSQCPRKIFGEYCSRHNKNKEKVSQKVSQKVSSEKEQCMICCLDYCKTRYKVSCSKCNENVCSKCCETYLLGIHDDPNCMYCHTIWNKQFLIDNFTQTFIRTKYNKARQQILFDRERALFPQSLEKIAEIKEKERLEKLLSDIRREISIRNRKHIEAKKSLVQTRRSLHIKTKKIRIATKKEKELIKKEKELLKLIEIKQKQDVNLEKNKLILARERHRETLNLLNRPIRQATEIYNFKHKCPKEDCNGMLNSKFECVICNSITCKDCYILKENEEHECKKEDIDTFKMLCSRTKPCPNCHTLIFKIEGCFGKDTRIPIWNGGYKMVQDIKIGDKLIGDDGNIRIVKQTFNDIDDMYKVRQLNGIEYNVNSKHTLVLKSPEGLKEILVSDYLKLDKVKREELYGYKSSGIKNEYKHVNLDPYILGLWLGDGIVNGTEFSSNDEVIIKKWVEWANNNGGEVVHCDKYRFRIRKKEFQSNIKCIGSGKDEECKGCLKGQKLNICSNLFKQNNIVSKLNPLKKGLDNYNLVNNKHIPNDYIFNDREIRLQLLAGIIDTDGCVPKSNNKRIIITQTRKELSDQIVFLARSLGFNTTILEVNKNNTKLPNGNIKDCKTQYRINISGDIEDIPTILKKGKNSNPNKDWSKTRIKVEYIGKDRYYGFLLDENHRFILDDFTVVKNCNQMFCTQCNTPFSWTTGRIITGEFFHNPHYFDFINRGGNAADVFGERAERTGPTGNCNRVNIGWANIRNKLKLDIDAYSIEIIGEYVRKARDANYARRRYEYNRVQANESHRIRYLQNQIDEKRYKQLLTTHERTEEKSAIYYDLIDILSNQTEDIIHKYYNNSINVEDFHKELKTLFNFVDNSFAKVSTDFKCKKLQYASYNE